MRTRLFLPPCFALLMACSATLPARGDYAVVDPKDIEVKVELDSPPPLPFQPVRLRLSIRNVSKKRLGPLPPADYYREPLVRGPQDERYRPSRAGLPFAGTTNSSARSIMNQRAPLYLDPGEQTSASFALGRRRGELDGPAPLANAADVTLFPEPGGYWLKCLYVDIEKEIRVEVREPEGDDRVVYEMLRKNLPLASALLEGVRPPDAALVPKTEAVLELLPKSSYAGDARFALARFYLKGNGFQPADVNRVDRARAATQLEQIYQARPIGAYYPNAMTAMKEADPRFYEINWIAGRLSDSHPDSLEWLERFAGLLLSGEPKDRKLVELIARRDYLNLKDPLEQRRATERFQAEVWTAYRKRVPAGHEQKEAKP